MTAFRGWFNLGTSKTSAATACGRATTGRVAGAVTVGITGSSFAQDEMKAVETKSKATTAAAGILRVFMAVDFGGTTANAPRSYHGAGPITIPTRGYIEVDDAVLFNPPKWCDGRRLQIHHQKAKLEATTW